VTEAAENYVDTGATRHVERRGAEGRGVCLCPGTPHDLDTADVRTKLGYGELAIFRQAGWLRSRGQVFSTEDAKASLLALGVTSWNLVRPDGSARPISTAEVERLDEDTVEWLYAELQPAITRNPLPNPSGAHSPGGRRASAGHTRTTKGLKAPTST
jgi:hypothetical protein